MKRYYFYYQVTIVLYTLLLFNEKVMSLESPNGLQLTFLEPSGVNVEWNLVSSDWREAPKITYKVKLWEVTEEITRNYKLLNGDQYPGLQTNYYAREVFNSSYVPHRDIREISTSIYTNYARVYRLQFNKLYEVRVIVNKGEETSISEPKRFRLVKSKSFVLLAQRGLSSCSASVLTNSSLMTQDTFVYESIV